MTEPTHALTICSRTLGDAEDGRGRWVAFYVVMPGSEASLDEAIELLRIKERVLDGLGGSAGPAMATLFSLCVTYVRNVTGSDLTPGPRERVEIIRS